MTYFRTYDADALITYKVSPGTIIYKEPALEEKKTKWSSYRDNNLKSTRTRGKIQIE